MSREIIFRAKSIYQNVWIEGDLFRQLGKTHILNDKGRYQVDPSTVCQYTGLTDRNDVKIWENDIIQAHGNPKELYRVCFGEFKVYDIETFEPIDKAVGWHLEVIPTNIISQTEPFNISLPLNDDWIDHLQVAVSGTMFDNL